MSLALISTLLRPTPSRAARGPKPVARSRTGAVRPPTGREALTARSGWKPKRRLAGIRRASHSLPFGERVVRFAERLVGVPYAYGGTSPRTGFDCSGLVRYVYGHFGISLSHSSFADFVRGRSVGRSQLQPGDLVFFDDAGHVGIYIGNSRFIDAPHTGTVVRISTLGWYGSSRFSGARRLR